jgi:hypothetical protein
VIGHAFPVRASTWASLGLVPFLFEVRFLVLAGLEGQRHDGKGCAAVGWALSPPLWARGGFDSGNWPWVCRRVAAWVWQQAAGAVGLLEQPAPELQGSCRVQGVGWHARLSFHLPLQGILLLPWPMRLSCLLQGIGRPHGLLAVYCNCSSSRRRSHYTFGRTEGHPPLLPVGNGTRHSLRQWQ